MVVLGDYTTIKEGLVTMGTRLAGRAPIDGPFAEKMRAFSAIYPTMGKPIYLFDYLSVHPS